VAGQGILVSDAATFAGGIVNSGKLGPGPASALAGLHFLAPAHREGHHQQPHRSTVSFSKMAMTLRMSRPGASRHFAAAPKFGRFRIKA